MTAVLPPIAEAYYESADTARHGRPMLERKWELASQYSARSLCPVSDLRHFLGYLTMKFFCILKYSIKKNSVRNDDENSEARREH